MPADKPYGNLEHDCDCRVCEESRAEVERLRKALSVLEDWKGFHDKHAVPWRVERDEPLTIASYARSLREPASYVERPKVHTCDGCGSWTNEPVMLGTLISMEPSGWGWVEGAEDDDGHDSLFCPECQ